MANVLITGAAGFIGTNFVHYWLAHHPQDRVWGLDALTYAGNLNNLDACKENSRFQFVHGDIRDQDKVEQLLRDNRIDTLVHFAAESHVDRSIHGPDIFIDTNVNGTHSLLKAVRNVWLEENPGMGHRFHHVSTDEVYGTLGPKDPAFSETTPYAPNSPYAASKAASDHLVRAYHHTYGLQVSTSNCSNNYGPYHFPEKLIPLCIVNILEGKPLPVYGDGKQIRDWLYVEDHCSGIEAVIQKGRVGETYNVGGCNQPTNIELIHTLCQLINQRFAKDDSLRNRFPDCPASRGEECKSLTTYVTDRAGHDRRYAINADKAAQELDWKPSIQIDRGLELTLDWYLNNEPWWRTVMDGSYRQWLDKHYSD